MSDFSFHKHEPRRCTTADVFTFGKTDDPAAIKAFVKEADAYFSQFAAPTRIDGNEHCFHCGGKFGGLLANLGVGVGIEWGIIHGEGACSGCRWPYRGIHYPKGADGEDLFTLTNLFLAYMPEHVSERQERTA